MRLDDEDTGKGLQLVPEPHGMDVPSACTIIIVAGKWIQINHPDKTNTFPPLGKYLDKVDRVMTQVDRITENIDHISVAAFIFRDKESDEDHYSTVIRYLNNAN